MARENPCFQPALVLDPGRGKSHQVVRWPRFLGCVIKSPENETGARYRGKRPPPWLGEAVERLGMSSTPYAYLQLGKGKTTATVASTDPLGGRVSDGPRLDAGHHANVLAPDPLGCQRITLVIPVIDRVDRCETMTDTRV